jgi:DNA-binding NtrC family response regulator
MSTPGNGGRLILIVEDEMLIACSLQAFLEDSGERVLGPVADVSEALALLQDARPDVALIDYRLGTGTTEPLLPALQERNVPVCVLTGYSQAQLPAAYAQCVVVEKPFRATAVLAAMDQAGRGASP